MNKPRLIDANELKKKVEDAINSYHNNNWGGYYLAEDVIDEIEAMPTAYDIDEVVRQLEIEKRFIRTQITPRGGKNFYEGFIRGLNKAIEIVKGGAE